MVKVQLWKSIMRVAKENNIKVIEDAAQAIGTLNIKTEKYVGTIGDIGLLLILPIVKILVVTVMEDLLQTDDDDLAYMLVLKEFTVESKNIITK